MENKYYHFCILWSLLFSSTFAAAGIEGGAVDVGTAIIVNHKFSGEIGDDIEALSKENAHYNSIDLGVSFYGSNSRKFLVTAKVFEARPSFSNNTDKISFKYGGYGLGFDFFPFTDTFHGLYIGSGLGSAFLEHNKSSVDSSHNGDKSTGTYVNLDLGIIIPIIFNISVGIEGNYLYAGMSHGDSFSTSGIGFKLRAEWF